MAKIHHAITGTTERWVFDAERGPVLRSEMVKQDAGTDRIVHEGRTYERGPDGAFNVPEDVAQFFLRQPDWHPGPSPFVNSDEVDPVGPRVRRRQ